MAPYRKTPEALAALTPEQTVDALLFSLNQSNKLTIS